MKGKKNQPNVCRKTEVGNLQNDNCFKTPELPILPEEEKIRSWE